LGYRVAKNIDDKPLR